MSGGPVFDHLPGASFVPPSFPTRSPFPPMALLNEYAGYERALLQCRTLAQVEALLEPELSRRVRPAAGPVDDAVVGSAVALWYWLRGGKRVIMLTNAARDAIGAADEPPPLRMVERSVCVRWVPRETDQVETRLPFPAYIGGVIVTPPNAAGLAEGMVANIVPFMLTDMHDAWVAAGTVSLGPTPPDEDAGPFRFCRRVVAALQDERLSMRFAFAQSTSTAMHRARKAGIRIEQMELTPDALGVWKPVVMAPPVRHNVGERGEAAMHVVHGHTARYWLTPDERGMPPRGEPEMVGDVPLRRGGLVAARLPRVEHVRGKGAGAMRIARLRKDGER